MDLILYGSVIDTEAAFHTVLREASGVDWYGGNLDALFDLLVSVVDPPISIRWIDAARSRRAIGARFDRILTVIFDAIEERGDGQLSFAVEA